MYDIYSACCCCSASHKSIERRRKRCDSIRSSDEPFDLSLDCMNVSLLELLLGSSLIERAYTDWELTMAPIDSLGQLWH